MEEQQCFYKSLKYPSVFAGLCGSIGSICGKFAGSVNTDVENCVFYYILKCIWLLAMVGFNTCGCTLYTRSLQQSSSSLEPTLLSSAVNYVCSALAGRIFFGEATSLLWWCGTSLILLGIVVASTSSKTKSE